MDGGIKEIEISSPFFSDPYTATFEILCDLAPQILITNHQLDRIEVFNDGLLAAACFDRIDLTVNKIALTDDDLDRYLRAQLLLLKGPAGAWALCGGPNFTTSALLGTEDTGNIERRVLRHEPARDYFVYLLDAETPDRKPIVPESVKSRSPLRRTAPTKDQIC